MQRNLAPIPLVVGAEVLFLLWAIFDPLFALTDLGRACGRSFGC